MKKTLVLVIYLCLISTLVYSCGIRTHIEVGHRALFHYNSKLMRPILNNDVNQEAFQAGNPFPDWGYGCGYGDERYVRVIINNKFFV